MREMYAFSIACALERVHLDLQVGPRGGGEGGGPAGWAHHSPFVGALHWLKWLVLVWIKLDLRGGPRERVKVVDLWCGPTGRVAFDGAPRIVHCWV